MESIVANAVMLTPEDYPTYNKRVSELCTKMSANLGLHLDHSSLDYSADKLSLWLDHEFDIVAPRDENACYELVTLISLKGRLFTFILYKKRDKRGNWYCVSQADSPDQIMTLANRINVYLQQEGYVSVTGPELSKKVPGSVNQLDGSVATVFNVLFGELD